MYSLYWGAGIGVALGAEGAVLDVSGYDGFSFTLEGAPAGELRIGVVTTDDPENSFFTTSAVNGENSFTWDQLAQGSWVDPAVPLDLTKAKDIQFQVASAESAAIPFDFCISNLKFLGEGGGLGGQGGGLNQ
jgi:hypothetical protein